jgi:hypothetical protein
MGGFELYDSDSEQILYPLDLKHIEELVETGAIDFPKITEKEIEDRSKGDIISKGLVVVQTGWFIMQCIVRGVEHLAVTKLEIMTVAFAFLNLITYIFWWKKPLTVTCPIRIVLKEGHRAPEPRSPEIVSLREQFWRMMALIFPDRDGAVGVDLLREKRVPTFYAGRIQAKSKLHDALLVVEMIVAMVFGGIHCIAWSFSFPTRIEQILWRVSSIATVSTPFLILVLALVFDLLDLGVPEIFTLFLLILSPLIYVLSRLVLLILSFISLRSLPPSAFYTVRWTTFIPHVG